MTSDLGNAAFAGALGRGVHLAEEARLEAKALVER